MASAVHGTVRKRVLYLFVFVSVVMVGLACRLIYLQFFKSGWLAENAVEQRVRDIPVEAKRGKIYDRAGREMGVSISTDSIYAIPAEIQDVDKTAAKLAALLNLDHDKLAEKLKKRQAFTWVKRKIADEEAQQIKQLSLPGIGATQETRRYYPNDNIAAHVLGFTGIDSQGLDGVELTFDSYLKGRAGSIVIEYDARGREIPHAVHRFIPPVDGNDVYLTIDLVIQKIIERELNRVMQETQAKAATIIVMQPQTGEILALANRPDYNPNAFADYPSKLWRNIAVSNAYEPGSTFKIITTAAVIGENLVRPDERFFDPGEIEVQGRNIHCWKPGGHGSQTFAQVVQNSCNVGFVSVGLRLGRDRFYDYLGRFGFGKMTAIDLPGEAKGILIEQSQVKPINIATMAMGQGIAITPIQLIAAVAAVASDGALSRPQIVREVKDKDGRLLREFKPDVVTRVLDVSAARQVKEILESVVSQGTGKNAYLDGYRIAGKTGTAQKVGDGGYLAGKYVASFVGFTPADTPQVVALVIIDEPVGMYYGGQIAAPVFGAMMKDILQYLNISPVLHGAMESEQQEVHVMTPSVINLLAPEAVKELQKAGLNARVEETGDRVADQIPKPGSRVPRGTSVLLYTLTPRYETDRITVPDCREFSSRQAADALAEMGLGFNPIGSKGKAVKQDPPAGAKVLPGTAVTIFFE